MQELFKVIMLQTCPFQVGFLSAKLHRQQQQNKFMDWLTRDAAAWMETGCKIDRAGLEVLAYLAYETVGQIVELGLLVRNESDSRRAHHHRSGAVSFNPHFPNVQLGHLIARSSSSSSSAAGSNGRSPPEEPESPLRKRLKSGAAGGEN